MTLYDPVYVFFGVPHGSGVPEYDPLLDHPDELGDVVELGLLEYTLLGEILVYHELTVSQVV